MLERFCQWLNLKIKDSRDYKPEKLTDYSSLFFQNLAMNLKYEFWTSNIVHGLFMFLHWKIINATESKTNFVLNIFCATEESSMIKIPRINSCKFLLHISFK